MKAATVPRDFFAAPPAGGSILPLTLDGVTYEAGGKRLIDSVSLHLRAEPLTIVMGPNGAGKSLLLRLCHGLIRPTTGSVTWAEKAAERVRRSQAMVFQHPVLLRRSAAANIDYALGACGIPKRQRKILVLEVLAQAGLSHLARQPARVLSGGEQQRLALARALALKPQILFLDEPTSNLDPAATRAVEEMIHQIRMNRTKIVMTTHDLGQARRMADEIVFLHRGRLLEQAPAREFFMAPRCEEASAFLEGRLLW